MIYRPSLNCWLLLKLLLLLKAKWTERRETKHLSTNADSSTDTIGGLTKNTPKPDFF